MRLVGNFSPMQIAAIRQGTTDLTAKQPGFQVSGSANRMWEYYQTKMPTPQAATKPASAQSKLVPVRGTTNPSIRAAQARTKRANDMRAEYLRLLAAS